MKIPEGWRVNKQKSLRGQYDKSKFLAPEINPPAPSSQPNEPTDSDQQDQSDEQNSSSMSEEEYKYWTSEHSEEASYADDGKKYTHTYKDPKTGNTRKVRYGAKGYRIAPGTPKGDSYCARSEGDRKSEGYDCSGKDKNTPLCLSRAKWKCKGSKSMG